MTNDVQHLLMHLLETCLFKSFVPIFNWVICLLILNVGIPYIFWIQVSHQM